MEINEKNVIMYLRKSRADDSAQQVCEVLAKHELQLQDYAVREFGKKISEEHICREVVSGETIDDRPVMKKVLHMLESQIYAGVLVIEPQRLSRGDLLDCGRVINTFRYTNTAVITPTKIYNLCDEYDRRFFEMELMRGNDYLEYSKRIMNRGRMASVKQGNYIASVRPFGYNKIIAGSGKDKFHTLEIKQEEADVVIDFASAKAEDALLDYCGAHKLPVVVCTTGLSEEQLQKVAETAKKTAVLKSANMSLGINTLLNLLKSAAKVLAEAGFDMEIVEKHHKHKLDAPSGTALALADSMNEALGNAYHYTYDRSDRREERDPKEIGISAVRGGNIVGEHEVIFAGTDEVIEFKHTAYSKAVFGKGAVQAAKFLAGREPGLYDMQDVIAANA